MKPDNLLKQALLNKAHGRAKLRVLPRKPYQFKARIMTLADAQSRLDAMPLPDVVNKEKE